jgi:endonuclease III related protein
MAPSMKRRVEFELCDADAGTETRKRLEDIYAASHNHFGNLHWWPGDTPFEVCVGAILTQNTAWTNVAKAIANLKNEESLTPEKIHRMRKDRLARLIRSSGYFNQKAERLKLFVRHLMNNYTGRVEAMAEVPTALMREELLRLRGIGPETADSILLYALNKPIFVIDAYTKRIFHRKGFFPADIDYEKAQSFFHKSIPANAPLYNDFHAQIVNLGKEFCKKSRPLCASCPVRGL